MNKVIPVADAVNIKITFQPVNWTEAIALKDKGMIHHINFRALTRSSLSFSFGSWALS